MKLRCRTNPNLTGISMGFNTHALAEVIVGFDDDPVTGEHNGADSVFVRELEVFLEKTNPPQWKDMNKAFEDRDLIRDNYNTRFFEPSNDEDRKRGYTL